MIRDYLNHHILLTDGAMGTYYTHKTGNFNIFSELANRTDPQTILGIHQEYIAAGARLIRTNTFAANPVTLGLAHKEIRQIIRSGYELAQQAVQGQNIFIAASIGPIPEYTPAMAAADQNDILHEYLFIADTFLDAGADIFIFETFSSLNYLAEVTRHIKAKNPAAFILAQFVTTPDGYTRSGISAQRMQQEVRSVAGIDAYGFNCGSGPVHLYKSLRQLSLNNDIVSALPNAGYPELVHERTVYRHNPDYFAERMEDISRLGVKIIGGCCGTTPAHIRKTAEKLSKQLFKGLPPCQPAKEKLPHPVKSLQGFFGAKMRQDRFVVAVELDPPFNQNTAPLLRNAAICRENGVDVVTVADSPLGRARMDSLMAAAKIKRETGIETIPHICCRDKNINALKSGVLAAHAEGIRNVLAVTGDALAEADKSHIKNVFNLNSLKLIDLLSEMNREFFAEDALAIGGALNLNVLNKKAEVSRMLQKSAKGACFFLTQPIFSPDVIDFLAQLKRPPSVKILGGIMPLVSYKNAQFLNNEIPGITIPAACLSRFRSDMSPEKAQETGIELAVELAQSIRPFVDGFYFITPFNRIEMIVRILRQCSLA